jgi:hypothetical protein
MKTLNDHMKELELDERKLLRSVPVLWQFENVPE